MTDKEFITAFIASGIELREWREGRDVRKRLVVYQESLRYEWRLRGKWTWNGTAECYEVVAIILRQLTEMCDEACVKADVGWNGKMDAIPSWVILREWCNDDGYWEGDGPRGYLNHKSEWVIHREYLSPECPDIHDNLYRIFPTRREALLAAVQAIEQEK